MARHADDPDGTRGALRTVATVDRGGTGPGLAVHGLILAGGAARRMGGRDKGDLAVRGKPMLARVIERLAPQCASLALSANGDPHRFAWTGLPVVADAAADRAGPLAGVLAGLDRLADVTGGTGWLVTAPADTPFLPRDLVVRLAGAREAAGADDARRDGARL